MDFLKFVAAKEKEHRAAGELEAADRLRDAMEHFQQEK